MAEKLPFGEGASINRPPLFCSLNYQFWKVRMKILVESLDKGIWDAIENDPFIPKFEKEGACSSRLTWDVFVRNLARQLGTPSLWLPVDTCKEGPKGALAAVCTPTLKLASKKHQKLCTSVSEHREWHSEGGKRICVLCIFSPSGKQPFSSPLCVASTLEQATRVYSGKICQKFKPHFQHSRFYLNDSRI